MLGDRPMLIGITTYSRIILEGFPENTLESALKNTLESILGSTLGRSSFGSGSFRGESSFRGSSRDRAYTQYIFRP